MKRKRKRRKRISKDIPAKGRLEDICDDLWSWAIRDDWAWKCAACGNQPIEAHHLIPRQNFRFRYDMNNGIGLCSHHHQWNEEISPHQNPAGWMDWLKARHPERCQWNIENCRKQFEGTKTRFFYFDVMTDLRQYVPEDEFARMMGVRFLAWFDANV